MESSILTIDWIGMALKGGIVLAGAGVGSIALHRASAAHRHLVWTVALVCLPILTVLAVSGPSWKWQVLTPASTTALPTSPPAPHQAPGLPSMLPVQTPTGSTVANSTPTPPALGGIQVSPSVPWRTILVVVWASTTVLISLPLLVGIWTASRLGRTARRPRDGYWTPRLDSARRELGIRRSIRLLEHDHHPMPMTWGAIRPRLLLPVDARTWTEAKQRAVLLHELAHVRRHDYLTRALARCGLALHGFNPLAWIAWRRMRLESERACDDHVLAVGSDPAEYADYLVQIARRCVASRWLSASTITMARRSQLEGRILAILDTTRARHGVGRRRLMSALVLSAGLVIPLAAIRLVAQETTAGEQLIPALEAKMAEVMVRRAEGHAYKDKTSLDGTWEDFLERNQPTPEKIRTLMEGVEAWAQGVVQENEADEDEYLWRLCHLLSVMAEDAGSIADAQQWMERSLDGYPATVYERPSKHSKFQHLVNRLAGLRWTTDGKEAATREAIERFRTDPRFEYFFVPWWEQEARLRNAADPADALRLRQVVIEGYQARLKAFPHRAGITRPYMQALRERMDVPVDEETVGTIQDLINAASPGDVVEVPHGQHTAPLRIDKALTLRGAMRSQSMLKVKADRPAIQVVTDDPVVIEDLTIEWQRATSRQTGAPLTAIAVQDGALTIRNCEFSGEAGPDRCPTAVGVHGFGTVTIHNSVFSGFNFTVHISGGGKGVVEDCMFVNPGHCGITAGNGSEVTVRRTLVTGSAFHGLRCTGGTLVAEDNVIIANRNRGIYLGNRAAHGLVRNNVIAGNATGISAFGGSDTEILHNVLLENTFAAIDARSFCPIRISNNILSANNQGFVVWQEGSKPPAIQLEANLYWKNNSNDVLRIEMPSGSAMADPGFTDAPGGNFAGAGSEHGLADPSAIQPVWQKWEAIRKMQYRRNQPERH